MLKDVVRAAPKIQDPALIMVLMSANLIMILMTHMCIIILIAIERIPADARQRRSMPDLPTKIIPAKLRRLKLSGKFPMDSLWT